MVLMLRLSRLLTMYVIFFFLFFFNDTATTEIYTLSLHDALPIYASGGRTRCGPRATRGPCRRRSEEHTSELQSRPHLVCRLLLEKKKKNITCVIGQKKKNNDIDITQEKQNI